eukprot:3369300-Rhodomonas_salina.1
MAVQGMSLSSAVVELSSAWETGQYGACAYAISTLQYYAYASLHSSDTAKSMPFLLQTVPELPLTAFPSGVRRAVPSAVVTRTDARETAGRNRRESGSRRCQVLRRAGADGRAGGAARGGGQPAQPKLPTGASRLGRAAVAAPPDSPTGLFFMWILQRVFFCSVVPGGDLYGAFRLVLTYGRTVPGSDLYGESRAPRGPLSPRALTPRGTRAYPRVLRLAYEMSSLVLAYAMSGSEAGYAATIRDAMSGTEIGYEGTIRNAMSGTEVGYAAMMRNAISRTEIDCAGSGEGRKLSAVGPSTPGTEL